MLHKFLLPVLKLLILRNTQRQEIINVSANSHTVSNSSSRVKKSECSSSLEYNLGTQLTAFAFLSKADGDINIHICFRHFKAY